MESAIENLPRDELIKRLDELQKKGIGIVGEENIIDMEKEPKGKDIKQINDKTEEKQTTSETMQDKLEPI